MTADGFFKALVGARCAAEVESNLREFGSSSRTQWLPIGNRENNSGTIEVSADAGRALVERVTNAIDAVLELEHQQHGGRPECRTPREAAGAWLGVPPRGLSAMSPAERRQLADRVTVKLDAGDGRESRTIEVRDRGIGLSADRMPSTILSLNESNKLDKLYLTGAYGQGGSGTYGFSRLTFLASRADGDSVAFTVVRYEERPADRFKLGVYVYLCLEGGRVPEARCRDFERGTLVRHFGYDLVSYNSPIGPNSLYGSLNTNLFDPIIPFWLDSRVHSFGRRVIKGTRNALNGAVDDGDDGGGARVEHSQKIFFVSLGDFGQVGIEYWLLERPTKANKRPSAAFVNPTKPIVLTLNGQNHSELSQSLIRKDSELPLLGQRLVCHVDCNRLTPATKRMLFVSTRESERDVKVRALIAGEVVKALKSDDELRRLNDAAREEGMREQDEEAVEEMRSEVARLLRLHGLDLSPPVGARAGSGTGGPERVARAGRPHSQPEPIAVREPPTFVRIVWGEGPIPFHPEQRRYVRIETDANSSYHDPGDPATSRLNLIAGPHLVVCGTTALREGRLRAVVECGRGSVVGETGTIRVELSRLGLPVITDARGYTVVSPPAAQQDSRRLTLPAFKVIAVNGPDDGRWSELGWPDNEALVASEAVPEGEELTIYYSTTFPRFAARRDAFAKRDPASGRSFAKRYETWLAVHSLLHLQDEREPSAGRGEGDAEVEARLERQERCRVAVMSALFAAREVESPRVAAAIGGE